MYIPNSLPLMDEGRRRVDRLDEAVTSCRACNFIADTIHFALEIQEPEGRCQATYSPITS